MAATFLDGMLVVLILAMAGLTIAARTMFVAINSFVAVGLLLALAWVRLGAVDVALTEAPIGGGLTGVLLVGAAARLGASKAATSERAGPLVSALAAAGCATVAGLLAWTLQTLPETAPSLAAEAVAHLAVTEMGNPIAAVLLGYRAVDTMLEAVVVVLALIGVWSLGRNDAWGGRPAPLGPGGPAGPMSFLARLLPPVGILVGIHIVLVGAVEPGGKFQGGAILAAMWLLTMLTRVTEPPATGKAWLRRVLAAGPALFLALGLAGFAIAGAFLAFPPGFAKPLIVAIEIALALSIAAALGLLIAGEARQAPPA